MMHPKSQDFTTGALAETYGRLPIVLSRNKDRLDEAEAMARRATEINESLPREHPDNPDSLETLSNSLQDQRWFLRESGKAEQAEAA